jgi:hypothetical protein
MGKWALFGVPCLCLLWPTFSLSPYLKDFGLTRDPHTHTGQMMMTKKCVCNMRGRRYAKNETPKPSSRARVQVPVHAGQGRE